MQYKCIHYTLYKIAKINPQSHLGTYALCSTNVYTIHNTETYSTELQWKKTQQADHALIKVDMFTRVILAHLNIN